MTEEEIIEKCALAVWNLWSKDSTRLENTERSEAFSDAIGVIRALKANKH